MLKGRFNCLVLNCKNEAGHLNIRWPAFILFKKKMLTPFVGISISLLKHEFSINYNWVMSKILSNNANVDPHNLRYIQVSRR